MESIHEWDASLGVGEDLERGYTSVAGEAPDTATLVRMISAYESIRLDDPLSIERFGTAVGPFVELPVGAGAGSPVARLFTSLSAILELISQAKPDHLTRQPNWLQKLTGYHLEQRARFAVATGPALDELLQEAQQAAAAVQEHRSTLLAILDQASEQATYFRIHHLAADAFASRLDKGSSASHDDQLVRLSRRAVHLAIAERQTCLLAAQAKGALTNASIALDRHYEATIFVLPQWRQQISALVIEQSTDVAKVGELARTVSVLGQLLAGRPSLDGQKKKSPLHFFGGTNIGELELASAALRPQVDALVTDLRSLEVGNAAPDNAATRH